MVMWETGHDRTVEGLSPSSIPLFHFIGSFSYQFHSLSRLLPHQTRSCLPAQKVGRTWCPEHPGYHRCSSSIDVGNSNELWWGLSLGPLGRCWTVSSIIQPLASSWQVVKEVTTSTKSLTCSYHHPNTQKMHSIWNVSATWWHRNSTKWLCGSHFPRTFLFWNNQKTMMFVSW